MDAKSNAELNESLHPWLRNFVFTVSAIWNLTFSASGCQISHRQWWPVTCNPSHTGALWATSSSEMYPAFKTKRCDWNLFVCCENTVFSTCSCCSRTWRPTSTQGRSAGMKWVPMMRRRCSRSSSGSCPPLCSPPSTSTPSALSEVSGRDEQLRLKQTHVYGHLMIRPVFSAWNIIPGQQGSCHNYVSLAWWERRNPHEDESVDPAPRRSAVFTFVSPKQKDWADINIIWLMTHWCCAENQHKVTNDMWPRRWELTDLMATCHNAINL